MEKKETILQILIDMIALLIQRDSGPYSKELIFENYESLIAYDNGTHDSSSVHRTLCHECVLS